MFLLSSVGSYTVVNGYNNIKFSLHTEKEVSTVQQVSILARKIVSRHFTVAIYCLQCKFCVER